MKLITSTLITLLLIISGCYTAKKADKAIDKAQRNYPEVVAKKARSLYPCTTTKQDTAYIQHDTIIEIPCPEVPIIVDTLLLRDTFRDTLVLSNTNRIKVPVRVQIPTRTITKYVEDSAKIYVLNSELNTCDDRVKRLELQLQQVTESRSKWRKWCLITWVVCALYLLVTFALPKLLNR